MEYTILASGLVLIVLGWLCYQYPNLINPYGSLPPERKALVNIEGLKKVVAIAFVVTGFLLVVVATLQMLKVIDEDVSSVTFMALVFAMMVPLLVAMRRYNAFGRDQSGSNIRFAGEKMPLGSDQSGKLVKSSRVSKITWGFTWILLVFVAVFFALCFRLPQITVEEETLKISGLYGREIPVSTIVSVALLDTLPRMSRTNGSDMGNRLKGHFKIKGGEKCMVFVVKQAPYIELRTTDDLYYLNFLDKEKTEILYGQFKASLMTSDEQ